MGLEDKQQRELQATARIRTCQNKNEEQRIVRLANTRKRVPESVKNDSEEQRIMPLEDHRQQESERIKNESELE